MGLGGGWGASIQLRRYDLQVSWGVGSACKRGGEGGVKERAGLNAAEKV